MKKIFALMKTALVAAVGLSLFSCSVDGNKDDVAEKECGKVKLSIAIPKFMTPDTDTSSRMVMPSTKVIKLTIEVDDINYSKELSVSNSGLTYDDYNIVTAELDDVPAYTYPEGSMTIELYDSNFNSDPNTATPLTWGSNKESVTVTTDTGADSATVTFYALPYNTSDITDEFEAEYEYDENTETGQYKTTKGIYEEELLLDSDTISEYDIYYQAYTITIPAGYGLDVSLTAKNESQKDVAVVIYDSDGVASDAEITVLKNSTFNNKLFVSSEMVYEDTLRYVVLYTKGALTDLSDSNKAKLTFTLTEFED